MNSKLIKIPQEASIKCYLCRGGTVTILHNKQYDYQVPVCGHCVINSLDCDIDEDLNLIKIESINPA